MSFTVPGFYGPSPNPNSLSVYVTQAGSNIQNGMTITGLTGIKGVVTVSNVLQNVYGDVVINPGPPAISFPYVDYILANVSQYSEVSPSSLLQITFSVPQTTFSANVFRGPVTNTNNFTIYIIDNPIPNTQIQNWNISGLSNPSKGVFDVIGNVTALSSMTFSPSYSYMLSSNDLVNAQNYSYILTASVDQLQLLPNPGMKTIATFTSPTATLKTTNYGIYDPRIFDDTLIKGQAGELRELNSNVLTDVPAPREAYIEMNGRGFGTGALTAIAAIGAQEKYMYGGESLWIPKIIQHTPFTIKQRLLDPLITGGGLFLDTTTNFSVNLYPRDCGDLISNMYLSVSLPALPPGYDYTPLVGRAILQKVEFLIDGNPIETLTDDWYVLRDELFLDADEKLAMYQAVSGGQNESTNVPATKPVVMMIPLDFFFCRRHSHGKIGREKLEKPFFPMCAVSRQVVTIRFTFCSSSWITNAPNDVNGKPIDLINPRILLEEIYLSPGERVYYMTKQLNYKINHVWAEAGLPYKNGTAVLNLTAAFPVSMITWFVRNKLFETNNPAFYASRYQYGYSTNYVQAAVPVTFFNGVTINFLDVIQSATLYLNNKNVLSNFPGALYYSYKQPLDHNLSVPTKNIYMYCFSDTPKEYNQEGLVDFSKLNAQTTHLDIIFNPLYATQIQQAYTLYMYYYGYINLQISGGHASIV